VPLCEARDFFGILAGLGVGIHRSPKDHSFFYLISELIVFNKDNNITIIMWLFLLHLTRYHSHFTGSSRHWPTRNDVERLEFRR